MEIKLRAIQENDLEKIMNWRMDPDITKYMNTDPKLTIEGQRIWLQSLNQNESVMYWVVTLDNEPIGLINLADIDWDGMNSSWGYYIGEKKARSLKLAISLEMSLYDFVFGTLGFKELHNEVFSLNVGVIKLHLACGNEIIKEVKGEIEKNGVKYDITHLSITNEKWNSIRKDKKYLKIDYGVDCSGGGIFSKLHHIGYAVADIDNSMKYFKILGWSQVSEKIDDVERNIRITFVRSVYSNVLVELIQSLEGESPVSSILKAQKNVATPYHMCYETHSLEKSMNILRRNGYYVISNPAPAPALNNNRVAFMLNRNVGIIELLETENNE